MPFWKILGGLPVRVPTGQTPYLRGRISQVQDRGTAQPGLRGASFVSVHVCLSNHKRGVEPMGDLKTPAELKYTKTDEWIKVEGDEGLIGITDYAQVCAV